VGADPDEPGGDGLVTDPGERCGGGQGRFEPALVDTFQSGKERVEPVRADTGGAPVEEDDLTGGALQQVVDPDVVVDQGAHWLLAQRARPGCPGGSVCTYPRGDGDIGVVRQRVQRVGELMEDVSLAGQAGVVRPADAVERTRPLGQDGAELVGRLQQAAQPGDMPPTWSAYATTAEPRVSSTQRVTVGGTSA
jgi:hypothetical protein